MAEFAIIEARRCKPKRISFIVGAFRYTILKYFADIFYEGGAVHAANSFM